MCLLPRTTSKRLGPAQRKEDGSFGLWHRGRPSPAFTLRSCVTSLSLICKMEKTTAAPTPAKVVLLIELGNSYKERGGGERKGERDRERQKKRERRSSLASSACDMVISDLCLSDLMVSSLSSSCLTNQWCSIWSIPLRLPSGTPRLVLFLPLRLRLLSLFAGSSTSARPLNGAMPSTRSSNLLPPFSSYPHPSRLLCSVQVKSPISFSWATSLYPNLSPFPTFSATPPTTLPQLN